MREITQELYFDICSSNGKRYKEQTRYSQTSPFLSVHKEKCRKLIETLISQPDPISIARGNDIVYVTKVYETRSRDEITDGYLGKGRYNICLSCGFTIKDNGGHFPEDIYEDTTTKKS